MRRWLADRRRPWLLPRLNSIEEFDVAYRHVGSAVLLARVYRPLGRPPVAAVLDVHGGDWLGGDRFQQYILSRSLAANGVLIAAIEYQFAYPAAVEDVEAGLAWLKHYSPTVGAMGSSAGGHLVLLSALRSRDAAFAVADAPISDVPAYLETYGRPHPFWPSVEVAMEGSPLALVEHGQAALPPLLITHGSEDSTVPLSMSRRFVEAYRAAGGQAELCVFQGLGHAFVLSHPRRRESARLAERVLTFVTAHARPS
jgi:acetyl esterase/lipase